MFLGDWFDGFHEFHLTRRSDSGGPVIRVWDGADCPCLLSKKQAADVYRTASMILTACYDPITTWSNTADAKRSGAARSRPMM